jgi:hypothetical protein
VATETKGDIVYVKTMALVTESLERAFGECKAGRKAIVKGKRKEALKLFNSSCEVLDQTAKICAGSCQVLNSSRFIHPMAMVYHIMACETLQKEFDAKAPNKFPNLGDFDPFALGETLSEKGIVNKDAWERVLEMMLKPGGCCNVQLHVSKTLTELVKHSASLLQKIKAHESLDFIQAELSEMEVIWDTLNLDLQAYFTLTDESARALAEYEAGYPNKPVKTLRKSSSTKASAK